jgi:hypothetical protein
VQGGAGLGAPAGGGLEGPAVSAAAAGGCGLAGAAVRGGAWLAQAQARTTGQTAAASARPRSAGCGRAARRLVIGAGGFHELLLCSGARCPARLLAG